MASPAHTCVSLLVCPVIKVQRIISAVLENLTAWKTRWEMRGAGACWDTCCLAACSVAATGNRHFMSLLSCYIAWAGESDWGRRDHVAVLCQRGLVIPLFAHFSLHAAPHFPQFLRNLHHCQLRVGLLDLLPMLVGEHHKRRRWPLRCTLPQQNAAHKKHTGTPHGQLK